MSQYEPYHRSTCACTILVTALVLVGTQVAADTLQSSTQQSSQEFEVVSVRPSSPGGRYGLRFMPNGRMSATSATVQRLILTAYSLHESQLVGPPWINEERFDIEARSLAESKTTRPEMLRRLQSILEDRFGLRTHAEQRRRDVFVLTFARADRRLGKQIHPSKLDCASGERPSLPPGGLPPGPTCGVSFGGVSGGEIVMRYGGMTMSQIVMGLSQAAGRMVVDRTGLSGNFDVELKYAENAEPQSNGLSIFTAVREQLGLKLDNKQTEIRVVVIDDVRRASPN